MNWYLKLFSIIKKNYKNIAYIRKNVSYMGGIYLRKYENFIPNILNIVKKILFELKQNVYYENIDKKDVLKIFNKKETKKNLFDFEIRNIKEILSNMEFIEHRSYDILVHKNINFKNLMTKEDHPSFSESDTFFLKEYVLRSHTSTEQINMFEKQSNLIYHIGSTYRNDSSSRHLPKFHQIELVSKNIKFQNFYEKVVEFLVKFTSCNLNEISVRKNYFPFVHMGMEIDIQNREVCGMGITRKEIIDGSMFNACGIGIERLIMIKYSINNINDIFI